MTLVELRRPRQITKGEEKTGNCANDHDPKAFDNRVPEMAEIEALPGGFRLRIDRGSTGSGRHSRKRGGRISHHSLQRDLGAGAEPRKSFPVGLIRAQTKVQCKGSNPEIGSWFLKEAFADRHRVTRQNEKAATFAFGHPFGVHFKYLVIAVLAMASHADPVWSRDAGVAARHRDRFE